MEAKILEGEPLFMATAELLDWHRGDTDEIYAFKVVRAVRYESLVKAARDLLRYLDEHDWGHVPEGATADKLRDIVQPLYPMSGAYAPTATCKHGDHPYDCKLGCDPHTQADGGKEHE